MRLTNLFFVVAWIVPTLVAVSTNAPDAVKPSGQAEARPDPFSLLSPAEQESVVTKGKHWGRNAGKEIFDFGGKIYALDIQIVRNYVEKGHYAQEGIYSKAGIEENEAEISKKQKVFDAYSFGKYKGKEGDVLIFEYEGETYRMVDIAAQQLFDAGFYSDDAPDYTEARAELLMSKQEYHEFGFDAYQHGDFNGTADGGRYLFYLHNNIRFIVTKKDAKAYYDRGFYSKDGEFSKANYDREHGKKENEGDEEKIEDASPGALDAKKPTDVDDTPDAYQELFDAYQNGDYKGPQGHYQVFRYKGKDYGVDTEVADEYQNQGILSKNGKYSNQTKKQQEREQKLQRELQQYRQQELQQLGQEVANRSEKNAGKKGDSNIIALRIRNQLRKKSTRR